jgi:uncharacterized protein (TIGR02246 family)
MAIKSESSSAHEYAARGEAPWASRRRNLYWHWGALLSLCLSLASVVMDKQINDEAGVNAVVHGFEDAWNRHDMDAFATLFATDADFVNVIGMRWVGRDAIRQHHAASHATMFRTSTLRIGDTTVRFLKADVATSRSEWTLSGITSATGQLAPARTGILTHVLERIDGRWLIVLTQNTDISTPAG